MERNIREALETKLQRKDLKRLAEELISRKDVRYEQRVVAAECVKLMDVEDLGGQIDRGEALRCFVWERLNTGHWKEVDVTWRELYALVMLAKVWAVAHAVDRAGLGQRDAFLLSGDLVKMCDLGWMMGAPVLGGATRELAAAFSKLCENWDPDGQVKHSPPEAKRMKTDIPLPPKTASVTDLQKVKGSDLDLVDFLTEYKHKERPVHLSGLVSQWPAVARWDFAYLKKTCGFRLVPVELGRRYTDAAWTQTLMTIKQFVDDHVLGDTLGDAYLAQYELLEQVPKLWEDLEVPEFCLTGEAEDDDVDANVWFGPAGTVSPLHTDPKHNVLCQVLGRKFLRLFPQKESDKLYAYPDEMLSNTSMVDVERVDPERFPLFARAEGTDLTLEPGDAVYIPPKCWHFVKSLSPSMSVSFWFK